MTALGRIVCIHPRTAIHTIIIRFPDFIVNGIRKKFAFWTIIQASKPEFSTVFPWISDFSEITFPGITAAVPAGSR